MPFIAVAKRMTNSAPTLPAAAEADSPDALVVSMASAIPPTTDSSTSVALASSHQ